MTREEILELQPGDKIVFTEPIFGSFGDWIIRTYEAQEENGGYLTVSSVDGDFVVYIKEKTANFLFNKKIELYKEPNRPWSYKRDY